MSKISFDKDLLQTIDRLAVSLHLTRSAIVRDAIRSWIHQQQVRTFEEAWIKKLKQHPQDTENTDEWLRVQDWSED